MEFVCPSCQGPLEHSSDGYRCGPCRQVYPVVCGIPDFRLSPDPYIGIQDDRVKGMHLWEAAQSRNFRQLIEYYYSITTDAPPDLAKFWIARTFSEAPLARCVLKQSLLWSEVDRAKLLDIGCSTGAMLLAARGARELVGVDVGFRWLVMGKVRLRDEGLSASLVCANAEALPFADGCFDLVTAHDLIEHLRRPGQAVSEASRVSRSGARALWVTNNRYAPLPEPHVRFFGVGYLPRRWQPRYVAWRRKDLPPYAIRLRSARELKRLFQRAEYSTICIGPAPLVAPHWENSLVNRLLDFYNQLRDVPFIRAFAKLAGPRLWVRTWR
jgi:ubiquinone/menaquinone biosynthesis C-methylase UbiE/uncharacterized protein YbaR (Trm112 family)